MFDDNLQRQPSLQQNFGRCLMTRFKDSHHFSRTLGDVWWESLRTATTSVELWTMFDDNPYSTTPYHKVLDFTTVLHPARRKWRKGRSATLQVCILPQFWTSNRHEVTRGLPWSAEEFAFYHSFGRPTRPKWRKGCSATSKICILPQFWASDTSEVTKGSIGDVKNLRFTTVLSVQHVRSDERVDPRAQKFAFYHSFERPTRPKWRKGRSASSEICILPQFWASDTHELTRGLSNPQVRSLRPRQKKNIF